MQSSRTLPELFCGPVVVYARIQGTHHDSQAG